MMFTLKTIHLALFGGCLPFVVGAGLGGVALPGRLPPILLKRHG
jgi:hypothetical protein